MRTTFKLHGADKTKIPKLIKSNPKGHELNRLRFLEYKTQGKTHKELGKLLGKCQKTLTNWNNLYRQKGLNAFINIDYNRHRSRLEPFIDDIKKEARDKGFVSLAHLVSWSKKKKVQIKVSAVHHFVKKNSIFLSKSLD